VKWLLLILLTSKLAAYEPVGARGYILGRVLGSNYEPSYNLRVYTSTGTNTINKITSTKRIQYLKGTLTYLTEKYGTFNDVSNNYEEPLKVFYKVIGNSVILIEADRDYFTINYSIM
jgi:hypothetical protein